MPGDLRSYSDLRIAANRADELQKEKAKCIVSQKPKRVDVCVGGKSRGRPEKRQRYAASTQGGDGTGPSGDRS